MSHKEEAHANCVYCGGTHGSDRTIVGKRSPLCQRAERAQGHGRTADRQRRHFQRSVLPVLSVQGTPVLCAAAPDAYRIVRPGHGAAGTA